MKLALQNAVRLHSQGSLIWQWRSVVLFGLMLAMLLAGTGAWITRANAAPAASPTPTTPAVTFDGKTYTNRLIHSRDPYLLLHAHNPVDWYPWGPEALQAARRENKPIFVSIGYSTCYWCHVAEREIYSNPEIAKLMNQWFINIKVDREQRPDIDRIYMLATQIMTGGGGWPNNVFLTPDLKPFYAGSYFPPQDQGKLPGFPAILKSMHHAWIEDHAEVVALADQVYLALQQTERGSATSGSVALAPQQWRDKAIAEAASNFDVFDAGVGVRASKFPQSPLLSMLLSTGTLNRDAKVQGMVTQTLEAMAEGGVMDQLGGGFHRYSIEPSWSIPHFEKMLYDNAQLLGLYAHAYAITKNPLYRQVALRTAHYMTTEMQAPGGGFYSAQDAEVDGSEGASYIWTHQQIEAVLGVADTQRFLTLYQLVPMPPAPAGHKQPEGDVLRLQRDQAQKLAQKNQLATTIEMLRPLRDKLLSARQKRPQPARDEKIVTATNALAIIGFAQAGHWLHDPALTKVAQHNANWLWQHAFDPATGDLKHQFFAGRPGGSGFLDDYALFGQACLTLHQQTGDAVWLARSRQIADAMLQRFARPDGRFVETQDQSDLLLSPPAEGDSVLPSGQSSSIVLLLELSIATGDTLYANAARRELTSLSAQVAADPFNWGALLAPLNQPPLIATLQKTASPDTAKTATPGFPNSADHVRATARLVPSSTGADLIVTIDIEAGYHINANPASDPNLIPTQLMLAEYPELKIKYPAGQMFKAPFAPQGIAVYEGRITLHGQLPQKALRQPVSASLRIQACNDNVCLAPATVTVPVH
ncbi:thioredoxin domain-containing protein [Sulfuriferula sp. GW1]|uniref:thioredoxin domain-containing protein n=1 Tax=Sulfuriferula sp. GW1 TaxID=3345111 RepID=UPI0039B0B02C